MAHVNRIIEKHTFAQDPTIPIEGIQNSTLEQAGYQSAYDTESGCIL